MAEGVDWGCNLTLEEKVQIVRLYSISQNNAWQTRKLIYQQGVKEKKWNEVGIEKAPVPSVSTIHRVNKTFDETGCVSKALVQGSKRKRTVTTAENMQLVAEGIFRNPDIPRSHRCLSDTLNISASPSIAFSRN